MVHFSMARATGVGGLTRLMSLILVCIGNQCIVTGLFELVTSEAIFAAISECYSNKIVANHT